jgi:hypothetical protein
MPARQLLNPSLTLLFGCFPSAVLAQDSYRLREALPAGHQYRVSSRADLSGSIHLSADMTMDKKARTIQVSGTSVIEYDERVIDGDTKGPVEKTVRIYRRMEFKRKVDGQEQESGIRGEVRRMVLFKHKHAEVPFSPDGPLTFGEIDVVRTDVFTPGLIGLLPKNDVKIGDRWEADQQAVEELTDLQQVNGKLECRLQEVAVRQGRRLAQVSFVGTVTGMGDDGPGKHQVEGYFFFDLHSNHLSYLYVDGVSHLLDQQGQSRGKIEGKYVLTRRLESSADLADDVVKRLPLEPNAGNTLLLFDQPALGVRFTYPRRWTVQRADARQILLDAQGGGGLVITLEPLAQTPTGKQFQAEATATLQKQGARILRAEPPQAMRGPEGIVERFWFEAELNKQGVFLDYYTLRHAAAGATIAGHYPLRDAGILQREVDAIARSLRLIPPRK